MKDELLIIEKGKYTMHDNVIFDDIYIQIFKGEIIGFLFNSMINRKYLLDIISGKTQLDSAYIDYESTVISPIELSNLLNKHVTSIDISSKLIDSLSISSNVLLYAPAKKHLLISQKKMDSIFVDICKKFDIHINPSKGIYKLKPVERVQIELIKSFVSNRKLVILEKFSDFLHQSELADIYELLCKLKKTGMSFIIIETYEDILFKWASKIIVFEDSKTIGIYNSADITYAKIYSIFSDNQNKRTPALPISHTRKKYLDTPTSIELKSITTSVLKNISFSVHKSEVINILFLDDQSFNHFVELMKGQRQPISGSIIVKNTSFMPKNQRQAVQKGVCFIEEYLSEDSCINKMTVLDNLYLPISLKIPILNRWNYKKYIKGIKLEAQAFLSFEVLSKKPYELSPGDLKKLLYLKWLFYSPDIAICVNPFSNLDVSLKNIVEQMIFLLQERGITVIILTSNIAESHRIGTRTVTIRNGKQLSS